MRDQDADESRKRTFLACCIFLFIPIVCCFAIDDFMNSRILEGLFILLLVAVLSGILFVIKNSKNLTRIYRFSVLIVLSYLCYELAVGGAEGHAFLWFYFFPIAVFYLFGKKEGVVWVLISLALSTVFLLTPIVYEYKIGIVIRFLVTYSLVSILGFGLEFSRNLYYQKLMLEKKSLENALNEVKKLQGLFPICSFCKKIRDDKGYWNQIEAYVRDHSEAEFSHSICPMCVKEHYPDIEINGTSNK